MGNCLFQKIFIYNEQIQGQSLTFKSIFNTIKLNENDLNKLFTVFCRMDADGGGAIQSSEMFSFLKVESTPFNETTFAIFDEEKDGELNFMEFVCCLWNLLTLSTDGLCKSVYSLIDPHCKPLTFNQLIQAMELVHSKKIVHLPYVLEQLTRIRNDPYICGVDGFIKLEDFTNFVENEKNLVYPIAKFVLKLKRDILGVDYWNAKTIQRNNDHSLRNPNFVTNLKILVAENVQTWSQKQMEQKKKNEYLNNKNAQGSTIIDADNKVFEYLNGGVNPNKKNNIVSELINVKHSKSDSKVTSDDALVQRRGTTEKPRERRTTVRSGNGLDTNGGSPTSRRPTVNNNSSIDGLDKLKPLGALSKPSSKMTLPPITSSGSEKPKERRSTKIVPK